MTGLRVLTILCVFAAGASASPQQPVPQPAFQPLLQPLPQPAPQLFIQPAFQAPPAPPAPAALPAPPAPGTVQRAPQTPRTPATPAAPAAPAPPAPGSAPPAPARTQIQTEPIGQLLNIQVDVTIVQEGQGEAPVRKVVSLTMADRQPGSVRSSDNRNALVGDMLNVDVLPWVQKNGSILTRVGLEYANAKSGPVVSLRAQPLLESGKSLQISRAVSPNSDRTVTVEVVAKVLK